MYLWLGICNCNCICIPSLSLSLPRYLHAQLHTELPAGFSYFSLSLALAPDLMQLHCDAAAGSAAFTDAGVSVTPICTAICGCHTQKKCIFLQALLDFQVFWFCFLFIFLLCITNIHMLLFLVLFCMSLCLCEYASLCVCKCVGVCTCNCIRLVLKVALYMHILCAWQSQSGACCTTTFSHPSKPRTQTWTNPPSAPTCISKIKACNCSLAYVRSFSFALQWATSLNLFSYLRAKVSN